MTTLSQFTAGLPLLSVLIFSPLVAAAGAALIGNERALRWWALACTTVRILPPIDAVAVRVSPVLLRDTK